MGAGRSGIPTSAVCVDKDGGFPVSTEDFLALVPFASFTESPSAAGPPLLRERLGGERGH